MLLIAATGLAFAVTRYVIVVMLNGQTALTELFSRPPRGWTAYVVLRRAQECSSALLAIFGGWTLVQPFLGHHPIRGLRRRLLRKPGATACIAALVGIGLGAAVLATAALTGRLVDGQLRLPLMELVKYYVLRHLMMYAGSAVAVTWIVQALAGRWKASADWIDRLGRFLGGLWIFAGLAWAAFPYLDYFI